MGPLQYCISEMHGESTIDSIIKACDHAFPDPVSSRENYPQLLAKICRYALFLAAYDQEPLGYAAMYANNAETKCAFITLLAVRPEKQGLHIGSELMNACLEQARRNGMRYVQLEVRKENTKAIALYHGYGFCRQENETDTSIFMIKAL